MSKMSVGPLEQCIQSQLLKAASAKVVSSQDLARERRSCETLQDVPAASAPLPPPAEPPSDVESVGAEASSSKPTEAKPLSKNITTYKKHVKVTLSGESRKFEDKEWGTVSEGLPLLAAQIFEELASNKLNRFDSFARSPDDRINLLTEAGCDSKFMAKGKKIVLQRGALLRQLIHGKFVSVENEMLNQILRKRICDAYSIDPECVGLKSDSGKFLVSYRSPYETMEKQFPSIFRALRWLHSMAIASKDLVCY